MIPLQFENLNVGKPLLFHLTFSFKINIIMNCLAQMMVHPFQMIPLGCTYLVKISGSHIYWGKNDAFVFKIAR